tara:strand:- start:303 stop:521 length:219 start_codon:yes stop_codon:yes gene_type:complete
MFIPEFNSVEQVKAFLDYGGENEWCRPMIEEYMELVHINNDPIDLDELNGWIEHEMKSATEGYEEWLEHDIH